MKNMFYEKDFYSDFLLVVLFKMPFKYLQGFVNQQEKIVILYYTVLI
jgi:hypothetical protein